MGNDFFIDEAYRLERENFFDPWTKEMLSDCVGRETRAYLVAESAGEKGVLVGMAGVENILGEGMITNVSVDRAHRRKGVGKALMEELIKRGRSLGITDFTLECRVSNEAARSLYESFGFVNEGIRPGFYRHPNEDAAIYWKRTE